MEVTDEMVKSLADLSRLTFNDQEKEDIKKDLQRMISFVEKLKEVDTRNVEKFEEDYEKCTIRYGDMKKQLAEDMVKFISPVREKVNAILADEKFLYGIMEQGKDKARKSAGATMQLIREAMGLKYY